MKEFKEALWKIIRNEGIVVNNQNLDWLLDRAEKLLINENKSNNFDVKSNEELFKQALVEGLNRRFDREIEEAKKIEQIEEMAVDLRLIDFCKHLEPEECNKTTCDHCTAEALYNAGYRKQSEGEWVKHGYKWQCTKCKVLMDIDGTPKENLLNYCPNCGAKMKGGEQDA